MTKNFVKQKNGQFIIIAVLFISTMIISIGALLYSTVTYYKYEPWEEYNTVIDGIQLNTLHLVELSLANYSNSGFSHYSILKTNLDQWKIDLLQMYPEYGVILDYSFQEDNGMQYQEGIFNSSLIANVTFSLDISSLGLTGYKFTTSPSLNLSIIGGPLLIDEVLNVTALNVTVTGSGGTPVFDLVKDNFNIVGEPFNIIECMDFYDQNYTIVYSLKCDAVPTNPFYLQLIDQRGIQIVTKVLPEN